MEFYKTAEGSFISFKWDTKKNNFLSEKEGRPMFDKVLIGTVKSPGQQKSELDLTFIREDMDGKEHKDANAWSRYGEQATAFLQNAKSPKLQGTPIEQMPGLDMKIAAALRALNIYTVEALAELSDTGLAAVGMGGRKLQAEAKAYVENCRNKESALEAVQKFASENTELKEQVAALTEIVNELKRNQEATAPKKKVSSK